VNAYKNQGIINSKLAVKVLKRIAKKEGGNYGSNIAKELNKSQSSICRVITELYNHNFVVKGERKRAQYYKINYEGMAKYWFQQIDEFLDENNIDGCKNCKKRLNQNQENIEAIISGFLEKAIESVSLEKPPKLSDILFNKMLHSLCYNLRENPDLLEGREYLECVEKSLISVLNGKVFQNELETVIRSN